MVVGLGWVGTPLGARLVSGSQPAEGGGKRPSVQCLCLEWQEEGLDLFGLCLSCVPAPQWACW